MRTLAAELPQRVGQTVHLRGWLNNLRALGKINFLLLRDRSGLAQIVIEDPLELAKVTPLHPGSILSIRGTVTAAQKIEITQPTIEVENAILEPPPIEYTKPTIPSDLEFILDHRPLALRNRELVTVFRIQAELTHAYRLFMHDTVHAVEYFAPNLLGASSEGGAEFFNVDYFGHTATLAQSSQLYKQIMVGAHERVFALMPFFRAEPSHTTRHLAEGKQFEFEMGFFDHWHEILDIQETCLQFLLAHLRACDLPVAVQIPPSVPFPRLTFAEAQELYHQRTGIDERNDPDLSPAAERDLCAWALAEKGTECLFITDWKREKRPFYAYPNGALSNTYDLLCAGLEITSGGQRRHTYTSLLEGLHEKGMDPAHFTDYLSIFRYGMPPHGGFGMGLERLTMTLLKLKNIREASLFPSDTKRIASNRIKAHIFFGGETIRGEIQRLCRAHHIAFEHFPDQPGTIKALILRGKSTKKNVQFNIPAHRKLDMKAVAALVQEKCEFEDPNLIHERFGLTIGSIPPFGPLLNLDTYFDEAIRDHPISTFSCGVASETIRMATADLATLVNPTWGRFCQ